MFARSCRRVRIPTLVLLLLTLRPGVAEGAPAAGRFAPVGDLAGHCWVGRLPGSDAPDTHCYEWVLQERFLRDRHRVTGPEGVYEGETFYRWNERAGQVEFWYFNSLGGVSSGTVRGGDGDGRWLFAQSYSGADESSQQIRTWLRREDDRSYTVDNERLQDGAWQPLWSMRLDRLDVPRVSLGGEWAATWDLVFNTQRDGNYEVYLRDLTTGAERNLTSAPETEWAYSAGDDGVLLVSDRAAGAEPGYRLYRLDPRSSAVTRLTDFVVADSWVGQLPGGKGFVACAKGGGDTELLLLDGDGRVVRQLTDNDAEDCHPDVTPDGKTVVFWSTRGGSAEIWAMGIDGADPHPLTSFRGNDGVSRHRYGGEGPPRVSPDGRRIAWMSIRDGADWDIYTMALDGSDVRRLTDRLSDDGYPSWSPDGRFVVFDSDRAGSFDIYLVPAAGGAALRLTDDAEGYEQAPLLIPKPPPPPG